MRKTYLTSIITVILSLALTIIIPPTPRTEASTLQHIFVISVDGLSYEGYNSSSVPNIKHLAGEGVIDEKCLAVRAETPEAAQASMFTGTIPEEHKFYSAEDRLQMASVLDILKQGSRSFMLYDGSGGKLKSFDYGEAHYTRYEAELSDQDLLTKVEQHFKQHRPYYNYIVLNDCREALLTLDDKRYYQTVGKTDQAIGDFLAFLRNERLYYDSIIVVTSPRSSSPSLQVPLIVHGPGFQVGTRISKSMIIDVTPTLCMLSGLKSPAGSRGIPLYDALLYTGEERTAQLNQWVKSLQEERTVNWEQYYVMQDEIYRNYHQIASMKEERQSIFDYAGQKEGTIASISQRLTIERFVFLGIIALLLAGYGVEYLLLKKKFLLFK